MTCSTVLPPSRENKSVVSLRLDEKLDGKIKMLFYLRIKKMQIKSKGKKMCLNVSLMLKCKFDVKM